MTESPAETDWSSPVWYHAENVPPALESLRAAGSFEEATRAADQVRSVASDDDSGALWPAAVPTTRRLLEIVRADRGPGCAGALDVLVDWVYWPAAAGFETRVDEEGTLFEVVATVRREVFGALDVFRSLAVDAAVPEEVRELADQLVTALLEPEEPV